MQLGSLVLWLWHRQVAIGLIRLLAWELPYAADAALKSKKKRKKKKKIGHPVSPLWEGRQNENLSLGDLVTVHEFLSFHP